MNNFKPKLLLHACCAPCGAYVIEKLNEEYELTVFIYNPNIHPKEEYLKRTEELVNYCKNNMIDCIEYRYDPKNWFKMTKGLEKEPEGGKRCEVCFWIRLDVAANYADTHNYDFFATTLSISPHKNSQKIIEVGEALADEYGVRFITEDFKKNDGFKKSCEIAQDNRFYRQNYCGCIYSQKEKNID